ncbi:gp082 [Rhodococcus phage ReqiPepy6]|uniref:Gp082 n=1 Tax=Rhodococcus phage ReqiPepy6 TaxID=691965 RepID=D4P7J3_9CAUD|nr:gp082 [Rhodococcus phage ReqiPepy6]ADD80973.1 gp082 [Rhodococcus phage ReqiPepy6]
MISDPCRPEKPNELYFVTDRFPRQTRYYWILQTHEGSVIGTSNETYPDKAAAMRNALTLFGREIFAGYHQVVDDDDRELISDEAWQMEKHNHISREVKLDGTCPSCTYVIEASGPEEKKSYIIANARPKRLTFSYMKKHNGEEHFWRLSTYDGAYLDSSRMPFKTLSSAINNSISHFGVDLINELKILVDAEPDIRNEVFNGVRCMFPNVEKQADVPDLTLDRATAAQKEELSLLTNVLQGEVVANTGPDRSSVEKV